MVAPAAPSLAPRLAPLYCARHRCSASYSLFSPFELGAWTCAWRRTQRANKLTGSASDGSTDVKTASSTSADSSGTSASRHPPKKLWFLGNTKDETSDAGQGCMLRSSQTVLATALGRVAEPVVHLADIRSVWNMGAMGKRAVEFGRGLGLEIIKRGRGCVRTRASCSFGADSTCWDFAERAGTVSRLGGVSLALLGDRIRGMGARIRGGLPYSSRRAAPSAEVYLLRQSSPRGIMMLFLHHCENIRLRRAGPIRRRPSAIRGQARRTCERERP
ncbi:hypothetical protein K438DRAFT_1782461 [Mycena galopus ATCC 62051]|nr:hypothetical protein K438DRAFT_1782461 [Mycena galopus ATCC 62051]